MLREGQRKKRVALNCFSLHSSLVPIFLMRVGDANEKRNCAGLFLQVVEEMQQTGALIHRVG